MNREQYEHAVRVIEQDATLNGTFFDKDGGACAVGGLFMDLHPDYDLEALNDSLTYPGQRLVDENGYVFYSRLMYEVGEAYGLTPNELDSVMLENDDHYLDPDGMEDEDSVIQKRRAELVRLLDSIVRE